MSFKYYLTIAFCATVLSFVNAQTISTGNENNNGIENLLVTKIFHPINL